MTTHNWAKLCLLGLMLVMTAQAAETSTSGMKGLVIGGSIEGGYTYDWSPAGSANYRESQWLLDKLDLNLRADVTEKTHVVLNHSIAASNRTAPNLGQGLNSANYFSRATLATPGGGSGVTLSNTGAYVDHEMGKGVHLMAGHMHTPFGMESLWDRYDMNTYYYSSAYTAANNLGWTYDYGFQVKLTDVLPGSFDLMVYDGRAAARDSLSPGLAARWWYEFKFGESSFTPAASTFLNRWRGSPLDTGITAGGMFKMGTIWVNAEWVYVSTATLAAPDTKVKLWSVYGEPGIDLGLLTVSAKVEYKNASVTGLTNSTSDWNVGAAISHTYAEKFRVRLAYEHLNLSGNQGAHANDLRLLVGTKW